MDLSRVLAAAFVGGLLLQSSAGALPVSLETKLIDLDGTEPAEVTLVFERVAPEVDDGSRVHRFDVQAPGRSELSIDTPGRWNVRLDSEDYWTESREVTLPLDDSFELQIFATATVLFQLTGGHGVGLPDQVELSFTSSPAYTKPSGREVPSASVSCSSLAEGFGCQLPFGKLDLRLDVANAAPIYLWDQEFEPHKTHELGSFPLVAGGSIAGFVNDTASRPAQGAEVVLAIPTAPTLNRDPVIQDRLDRLSRRAETNARGFFQFTGVAPGTYSLAAVKEGLAPTDASAPLTLRGDLEERLDHPLVLNEPNSLEITIHPPVDPQDSSWYVEVFSMEGKREIQAGVTSEAGVWTRQGLIPGDYVLLVKAADGSRWLAEQLTLEPGEQKRFYEIPLLAVDGSVSMGGDPVSGKIDLILRKTGAQVDFDVDEEGEFQGYLPNEGEWAVQFEMKDPDSARLALDSVRVERRSDGRPSDLEVEIPDTRVLGQVIDSEGQAVHDAQVVLIHLDLLPNSQTRSDRSGDFELVGLKPGSIQVLAREGQRQSEIQVVELREGAVPPPLRLELFEPLEIAGQVLGADRQPVPGAAVSAWLEGGSSTLRGVKRATTDVDGSFVLEIPAASSLSLFVQAPGHASRILHRSVDPEEPLLILLDHGGSALSLDLGERAEPARHELVKSLYMRHEGATIPMLSLLQHIGVNLARGLSASRVEMASLASGTYTVCAAGSAPGSSDQTPSGEACQQVFLNSGEVATLNFPES